jgi:hypothetical protein
VPHQALALFVTFPVAQVAGRRLATLQEPAEQALNQEPFAKVALAVQEVLAVVAQQMVNQEPLTKVTLATQEAPAEPFLLPTVVVAVVALGLTVTGQLVQRVPGQRVEQHLLTRELVAADL